MHRNNPLQNITRRKIACICNVLNCSALVIMFFINFLALFGSFIADRIANHLIPEIPMVNNEIMNPCAYDTWPNVTHWTNSTMDRYNQGMVLDSIFYSLFSYLLLPTIICTLTLFVYGIARRLACYINREKSFFWLGTTFLCNATNLLILFLISTFSIQTTFQSYANAAQSKIDNQKPTDILQGSSLPLSCFFRPITNTTVAAAHSAATHYGSLATTALIAGLITSGSTAIPLLVLFLLLYCCFDRYAAQNLCNLIARFRNQDRQPLLAGANAGPHPAMPAIQQRQRRLRGRTGPAPAAIVPAPVVQPPPPANPNQPAANQGPAASGPNFRQQ